VLLEAPRGTYWRTWDRYVRDHLLRRGLISEEDLSLYAVHDSVETAVREIATFYRVYHSSRYVRELLALRLNRALAGDELVALADEFRDIVVSGTIVQREAFPVERDEPETWHLPRLVFRFNRMHFGRLRQMIDRLNGLG